MVHDKMSMYETDPERTGVQKTKHNTKGATTMISAIIYTSVSGSCERYAREMSRKLAIPCYEQKNCGLPKGMEVVFIGWLMNGQVSGLSKAMKDYDVKAVVQVGMSPVLSEDVCRSKNNISADVKVFSVQGRFDMDKLPIYFKPVMKVVNKGIAERLSGKADLTAAEKATYQMATTGEYICSSVCLHQSEIDVFRFLQGKCLDAYPGF